MTQDTITKIDNLLLHLQKAARVTADGMEVISEFAQRPYVRRYLTTKQLLVAASLTALAVDVHIVTCDLRSVLNDMRRTIP
jgi:hypothetical protein